MKEKKQTEEKVKCCYCGKDSKLVWIHGHGQCEHCKTNIDECCRGENSVKQN